jgi:hypothetical protein
MPRPAEESIKAAACEDCDNHLDRSRIPQCSRRLAGRPAGRQDIINEQD